MGDPKTSVSEITTFMTQNKLANPLDTEMAQSETMTNPAKKT